MKDRIKEIIVCNCLNTQTGNLSGILSTIHKYSDLYTPTKETLAPIKEVLSTYQI